MRILIIFLFSLPALCPKLFAQTVFAPQGAVWHYYRDGEPPVYNNKYLTEKDTFYEGHYCAKVVGTKTLRDGSKETLKTNYFYTSGDTVLYYHDSLRAFTPLYIFDVKVGDTLSYAAPLWSYSLKTYKVVVTKIDTIIIDGTPLRTIYHKVIYPVAGYTVKYTERFGGYYVANIISIIGPTTTDHIEGLRCYSDKSLDEIFVEDKWNCDYVPNNIVEKALADNIRIFPNPVSEKLNISFDKSMIEEIKVLGLDGRILYQKTTGGREYHIDMSSLTNGIYYLQIKTAQENFSRLITVLH